MTRSWAETLSDHRDILLGMNGWMEKLNSCTIFFPGLDSMTIEETSLTKKSKQKKSSLWNIFSNYGSQPSAESL